MYLLCNIFAINYVKLIKFITNQKQRKQMFLGKNMNKVTNTKLN